MARCVCNPIPGRCDRTATSGSGRSIANRRCRQLLRSSSNWKRPTRGGRTVLRSQPVTRRSIYGHTSGSAMDADGLRAIEMLGQAASSAYDHIVLSPRHRVCRACESDRADQDRCLTRSEASAYPARGKSAFALRQSKNRGPITNRCRRSTPVSARRSGMSSHEYRRRFGGVPAATTHRQ